MGKWEKKKNSAGRGSGAPLRMKSDPKIFKGASPHPSFLSQTNILLPARTSHGWRKKGFDGRSTEWAVFKTTARPHSTT